jgi:RimJ/RimL family protein N-acetyltransferase
MSRENPKILMPNPDAHYFPDGLVQGTPKAPRSPDPLRCHFKVGNTMSISICDIAQDEVALIRIWAANIHAGQFTSRLYPKAFDAKNPDLPDSGILSWYAIRYDHRTVGHVWIERETPEADLAVLGILIGETDLFGKGIGRAAIRLAVDDVCRRWPLRAIRLNVRKDNHRGIACYRRCGFTIVGEGEKEFPDGPPVAFHVMERSS